MESKEARARRIIAGLVDMIDTMTNEIERLPNGSGILAKVATPENMELMEEAGDFGESD